MADVNWNLAVTPDPFKQIAEGADYSKRIFDQAALLQAGQQYAGGDLTGAANAVARRGDFKTAGDLSDLGTARTAGAQYAAGDYAGAGKTYAAAGKLDEAGKLQDQQIKTIQQQQDAIGRVGGFINDVNTRDPASIPQAWGIAKQQLQAVGIPPERIADFEKLVTADPAKAAATMGALAKIEAHQVGDDYVFINPVTRQEVSRIKGVKAADLLRAANEPFDAQGNPNPAVQNFELAKAGAAANIRAANAPPGEAGWTIAYDPQNNNVPYWVNTRTRETASFTDPGKPYTPQGFAKPGTNTPRSAVSTFIQQWRTEHPNATAEELSDATANFGAQQAAVRAFATGPQGETITRLNTAVSHLDTLQLLAQAMDNGDVQMFNRLRNAFRTEFGSDLPTNFRAAAPIVAGEIAKAVVGGTGGTREDRDQLEKTLSDAASKSQLSGAANVQKSLLRGQLQSRRQQYEIATGRKDFDKFLSGETLKELGVGSNVSPGATPQAQGRPTAARLFGPYAPGNAPTFPQGAIDKLQEGVDTEFDKGRGTWTLKNGQPVRVR